MPTFAKLAAILSLSLLTACSTVGRSVAGINNFDQVSPILYRGAQPTDQGIQTLAAYHVKTIINLREVDDPREAALAKAAGMTYLFLPQDAFKVAPADAHHFLSLLAQAPTPVFVHCHAGRDRTGLAVAAYRLRIQQWTAHAALRDLYTHGHQWVLFPKVRTVIDFLAQAQPAQLPPASTLPISPLAAMSPPQ